MSFGEAHFLRESQFIKILIKIFVKSKALA